MDVGLLARLLFRGPLVYCIHTQERGLLGPTSDSFWRLLGDMHERLDRSIVRRAVDGPVDPEVPASAIHVASGSVTVLVDRAAWDA